MSFRGSSESEIQADSLAQLLRQLDFGPTVIIGGSGGARVSLLTAARHPDVARGLAIWWISGGVYGLMSLGTVYCAGSITTVWNGTMEDVANLPEWDEVIKRNPRNRERFLGLDPGEFKAVMEGWMHAYCACGDPLVPGLTDEQVSRFTLPTLVFRSGKSDMHHTRETSQRVAAGSRARSWLNHPGETESGSSGGLQRGRAAPCSSGGRCSSRNWWNGQRRWPWTRGPGRFEPGPGQPG